MPIEAFRNHWPSIHPNTFIHNTALLIGEVQVEEAVSIWPHCVLRGDSGSISIGKGSNLQEACIVHATTNLSSVHIGEACTIGHRALLHGCTVAECCLVGMGAILLDNCHIGAFSLVGAGALVPAHKTFPERSLLMGTPAKLIRKLSEDEIENLKHSAQSYWKLAGEYVHQGP
ncbi:MAG: gamma carbonic anhydrase family protein [Cystobacterineae bacterium]|nr:gamma carbonic anhydrase family protein [Cystobacterineae bacterium]